MSGASEGDQPLVPSSDRSDQGSPGASPGKLLSGTAWNALGQAVPLAGNIAITPYLIHRFGVDRWGLIALVVTIQSIVTSLDGGLSGATNRYFAMYAGTDDRVRTTQTLLTAVVFIVAAGTLLGVVSFFIAPVVVTLFAMPTRLRPETLYLLRAVMAVIALGLLRGVVASVLTARRHFALANALGLSTYIIWIGGLVLSAGERWGLRGVAVTIIVQQLVGLLLVIPPASRYLDRSSFKLLGRAEARKLFLYSSRVQAAGLLSLAVAEVDSLVIGTLLSTRSLAMFSAGNGLALQFSSAVGNGVGPAITHLSHIYGRDGQDATQSAFIRLQRYWVVICNGLFAVAIGSAYYIVVDWLGPTFSVGGWIATESMLGQAVVALAAMLGVFTICIGRADIEMRVSFVGALVNVVLIPGFIFFGVEGVAGATAIALIVACMYLLRESRRRISAGIPSFYHDLPVVPSLVVIAAVFACEHEMHPFVPTGPAGLLAASVPALVGAMAFFTYRAGIKNCIRIGRAIMRRSPGELRALLEQDIFASRQGVLSRRFSAAKG